MSKYPGKAQFTCRAVAVENQRKSTEFGRSTAVPWPPSMNQNFLIRFDSALLTTDSIDSSTLARDLFIRQT